MTHTNTAAHRLLRDMLHPEALGWAVSDEVRARARLALAADEADAYSPGRVYVAGPMTGLPDYNRPAFNHAAAQLREAGYQVFNPAGNGVATDAPWHHHMRRDISELVKCGRVALLPGWEDSVGATLEHHIAHRLSMQVMYVEQWLDIAPQGSEVSA